MKKNLQNKKGFTLVELIVVIAIIAILAALAVPRVEDFVDDARQAQRKADFRSMYTGVTAGYTDWIAEKAANELAAPASGTTKYDLADTGTEAGKTPDTLKASVTKRIPAGHSLAVGTAEAGDVKKWNVVYEINTTGEVANVTIINDGYTSVNGEEPKKN